MKESTLSFIQKLPPCSRTVAMKQYNFRWDGGELPKRHETFLFQCDADAMMAARKFKNKHHIDVICVNEMQNCGDGSFARRPVVVYK